MVGSGVGAKNGVLFKTAASLEAVGRANIIALDKTGTITEGKPDVTDIIPYDITENELLKYAAALEAKSEHPLAKAVTERTADMDIPEVYGFKALAGNGLSAVLENEVLEGGSCKYISQKYDIPADFSARVNALSDEGKTPLLFAKGGSFIGIIAVADTIKSDSAEAIKELKGMGLSVYMLTGDNERTADSIGRQAGVDEVIAGVLPDGKSKKISELKKQGKVIMVGDGINDAPALTTADTGIAIGAGADVAIDAADIVVMKNRLTDVSAAIRLSRATIRNIHENLFWAFIYNAVCIPLAVGLYDIEMKPAYGAAAMAMSSFCVCMNALRLNLVKIHDASHDKKIKTKISETEEKAMTKTLKIEGMMCEHCEARVKKTLEAIDGIESAAPDHNTDTAVITLSKDVPTDVIKAAIEAQDYKFIGEE
jgi:Cu2+-exporting ATPase